jgi:hypothetical protein
MATGIKGPLFNINDGKRYLNPHSFMPTLACNVNEVLLASNIFVTCVDWWKKSNSLYHKFLVFYVEERLQSNGKTPRKSVFLIERNASNVSTEPEDLEEEVSEPIVLDFYKDLSHIVKFKPPPPPLTQDPQTSPLLVTDFLTASSNFINKKKRQLSGANQIMFSSNSTDSVIYTRPEDKFLCCTLTIHGDYISVPVSAIGTY